MIRNQWHIVLSSGEVKDRPVGMTRMGEEQAVLVGNSAGGTIALLTALTYPERVVGLVLVDAAVYVGGGTPGFLRPLLNTPQMRHLGPSALGTHSRQPRPRPARAAGGGGDAGAGGHRR